MEEKSVKEQPYHVSKRKEDKQWQVYRAGSDKVIKLFDTKEEAVEYCKVMGANQKVKVLVHASKGEKKGKIVK